MGTYYNKTPIQAYKENGYPNLYLDFAGNKSLKDSVTKREDIVTFSRASTGTYFDADGILKTASVNTPRFDHDPVTGESLGLLIERSATKIRGGEVSGLLFPQGSWGTGTGISTDILAPDGTSQTYKIVSPVLTSGQRTIDVAYFSLNVASGSYYVCSFYVYATGETPGARSFLVGVGGADIDTNLPPQMLHCGIIEDGVFTQKIAANLRSVTFPKNKWVRYVTAFRAQSTCGASRLGYQIGLVSAANNFAGNSANIYIWGVQIESQSSTIGTGTPYLPTSYIYGSTGTRAQDFVTINGSNFTSFYNPSQFSIFSEFRTNLEYPAYSSVPEKNKFVSVYGIGTGGNRSAAVAENSPNPPLFAYRGFSVVNTGYKDQYGFNKIVNVYNENTLTFSGSLNGAAEVSNTTTAAPSQSSMTIGRLDGYSDTNLSGHLKKLVYWPQALPAGSLQTISKQGVDGFYTEKNIATDGLLIHLDAANSTSYPGTGTTWYDLSGNGNNATLVGSPVYTQTPGYFDITSDSTYARITNTNLIPRTNDFTYSLWIKFDSLRSIGTIFENGSWTDSLLFRYQSSYNFNIYAENTTIITDINEIFNNLNMWYNIVFRRKAGIGKIFINRMGNSRECIMTTDINLTNTNLFLMRAQYATGQWVDGKISTFSIYNRALSEAEIEQNFNALRGRYGV